MAAYKEKKKEAKLHRNYLATIMSSITVPHYM